MTRKPEALIGVFVKQLNAALADENAELHVEIERLRAALSDLLWCAENLQETDCDKFEIAIGRAKAALKDTAPTSPALLAPANPLLSPRSGD